ncbi:MAG: acyl-ACP--UDP-N-acetylglucosamine O-acyltransferase [Candidatus Omnitrophica bacterium]|nr:acyl-ACP--UDP-N-acetylglucosamine O-acyltransferase [Candidatus Omnitrophota bacterium]
MTIHPSVIIFPGAKIDSDVEIGPHTVIGKDVVIKKGAKIGPNVVIEGWTTIGAGCQIYTGAVIGSPTQDLKNEGKRSYVEIGPENIIREYVTINRATKAEAVTRIGKGNFIMTNVHIAHDCILGDGIIMANLTTLAGHVVVEDRVVIEGLTAVQQFIRIGRHAFIGGYSKVMKDISPYLKVAGQPTEVYGINTIGLERNGFSEERIKDIEKTYRILFRSKLNVTQALKRLEKIELTPDTVHMVEFVKNSTNGICR